MMFFISQSLVNNRVELNDDLFECISNLGEAFKAIEVMEGNGERKALYLNLITLLYGQTKEDSQEKVRDFIQSIEKLNSSLPKEVLPPNISESKLEDRRKSPKRPTSTFQVNVKEIIYALQSGDREREEQSFQNIF